MTEGDAAAQFAQEARASGLALPTSRRFNLRTVAVVIAVLIAGSLVFGYTTHWVTLNRAAPNPLAELPGCPAAGVSLQVEVEAGAAAGLAALWPSLASGFSTSTGGCLSVTSNSSASAFGPLAAKSSDAVVGPLLPTGGPLAADTYAVPLLLSPLSILVNDDGLGSAVNVSAAALAGAYLGSIATWGSGLLAGPNPGSHSSANVSVVSLPGPSEANALLSEYLSERNSTFQGEVGAGANVSWPDGVVASSAAEVATLVASTPGRIGYVPTDVCGSLPVGVICAAVESAPGVFTLPSASTVFSAEALLANTTAAQANDWTNLSGVAPLAPGVYPMVEVTYATLYRDLGTAYGASLDLNDSKWLVAAFFWVAADTSSAPGLLASPYGYFPVSEQLGFEAEKAALSVTYLGNWVLLPPSAISPSDPEAGEGGGETGEF